MINDIINKYISEAVYPKLKNKEIQAIYDKVFQDCHQILNVYQKCGHVLYRGMHKYNGNTVIKKVPRKNRKTLDMDPRIQKQLNNAFEKKFGWKPRSQGVFAIGSIAIAENYGGIFMFFPFDNFEFLWSPKIVDLFDYLNPNFDLKLNKISQKDIVNAVDTYTNKNLAEAIKSNHEIMFKCDNYYAINPYFIDSNVKIIPLKKLFLTGNL
jgi:hypothetical protein